MNAAGGSDACLTHLPSFDSFDERCPHHLRSVTADSAFLITAPVLPDVYKRQDNIFTISLEGRYQPKEPYDRARLLALGNVADVKDGTMPDYNLVALLDEHKDDMIGMYLEEFLKEPAGTREQKALYCGLEALLNAVQKTQ